jgi:predicted nucleotidyltransferase
MPKKWHATSKTFPEQIMERIVERAIQEGKLFELLFTEDGRKLWQIWGEERIRDLVFKKLKIKKEV